MSKGEADNKDGDTPEFFKVKLRRTTTDSVPLLFKQVQKEMEEKK